MDEEENRGVDGEGGTVITRSSMVVNCNGKFAHLTDFYNKYFLLIVDVVVQHQVVAEQETEALGTSTACNESVFQRKR